MSESITLDRHGRPSGPAIQASAPHASPSGRRDGRDEHGRDGRGGSVGRLPIRPTAIDHVQLAIPSGGEARARGFYGDLLGLTEVAKPTDLANRGGCWFEDGALKVHLGVDPEFRPARKAHVAFAVDDLAALVRGAREGGREVIDAEPIAGRARVFVFDPFGNRLEFLETASERGLPARNGEAGGQSARRLESHAPEKA